MAVINSYFDRDTYEFVVVTDDPLPPPTQWQRLLMWLAPLFGGKKRSDSLRGYRVYRYELSADEVAKAVAGDSGLLPESLKCGN